MTDFDALALKVADSVFADRKTSTTATWMSDDEEAIEFARRFVKEWVKGLEPFGVWHQGDTEDESDFFLGDTVEADCCGHCTNLYTLEELTK